MQQQHLKSTGSDLATFLFGAIASLWLVGFFDLQFGQPLSLGGDHFFTLISIKNFINGGGFRFVEKLGFPGNQDNSLFPSFDFSYKLVEWALTSFVSNPFRVTSILYLISILLIYTFSSIILHALAIRWWVACAASVAYAVSPYMALRAGAHDYLALYYSVPLGCALPFLQLSFGNAALRKPLTAVAIVAAGTSGLYYGFFTAMFVGVTSAALALANFSLRPLAFAAVISAAVLVILLATGYGTALPDFLLGRLSQPNRLPIEQLLYGLQISDAVHVYRDLGLFTTRFTEYQRYLTSIGGALGLFEWPGPLLTTIILTAPLVVIARQFVAEPLQDMRVRYIWMALSLISFGLIFATRGGLGFVFNYFVTPQIRAPQRIIPFLSFFALIALCLGLELLMTSRFRRVRAVLAVVIMTTLVASTWPATGLLVRLQFGTINSPAVANVESIKRMLATKNEASLQAILQMPHMPWPEAGPRRDFQDYQHALPYILDDVKSPTRWSYGSAESQFAFRAIRDAVQPAPGRVQGLAQRARNAGFDGILIEKAAFTPEEIATMLHILHTEGDPACRLFDDSRRTLYSLREPCDHKQ